jgi:drug/metabolite transporter superfamily protein YnfA
MLRRPQNDFNEHGREIAALRRELIDGAAAVFRIVAAFDDLERFKPLEPVRFDLIGGVVAMIGVVIIMYWPR